MSLSDKISPLQLYDDLIYYLRAEDVKQAVKELKDRLRGWLNEEQWKQIFGDSVDKIVNEIFGEKLV